MSGILNKMLNFVGLEAEEVEEITQEEEPENNTNTQLLQGNAKKQVQGKVVNLHTQSQFKVVIMQPSDYDDAQEVCNHLKNKEPVVVNLENVEKTQKQRMIDFFCGAVYALDGTIQKVAAEIILLGPSNVDILGDFKEEIVKNKSGFPWLK